MKLEEDFENCKSQPPPEPTYPCHDNIAKEHNETMAECVLIEDQI
jgi:hypothetical protein